MASEDANENHNEVLIKFLAPRRLKELLDELATERNVARSALLRLVLSEYIRRTRQP